MNPKKLLRYLVSDPVHLSHAEKFRTAFGALVGMLGVAMVSSHYIGNSGLPLLVASMGASAVLLFAIYHSPLSQPWPFAGSHMLSATIGVACALWIPNEVVAAAVAIALAIYVMHLTHSLHPPGGASALLPVMIRPEIHKVGFSFVLLPVGLNVALLLTAALLVNNLLKRRSYPARAFEPEDDLHHHADPRSLDRVGITHEDLHHALAELDSYLDVSEDDLNRIYHTAGTYAYRRRMGQITCADIMSRDVITATPATTLEQAWALLRFHRVKVLPVLNAERRVVGVLSLVDLLKRADLRRYTALHEKLLRVMRRALPFPVRPPRHVGELMVSPVVTVGAGLNIAEVVPLLSDRGLHHLPVVDEAGRLVGIVTQSDLIAALYQGALERGTLAAPAAPQQASA